MSKIDELIAELCPEGVFFITLGDFVDFIGGHSFPAAEFNTEKRGLRVIRIGDVNSDNEGVFYDGEFPKKALVLDGDLLMSLSGDLNLITWSRGDSLLNQRVAKLVVNPEKSISRYVFHFLKLNLGALTDATSKSVVANLSMASLRSFKIPLPPLEVQREIVAILDKFTQLEAELEAELEARRSQYEHTRGQLLDVSGDLSSHPLRELIAELRPAVVEYKTLGELLETIPRGRRLTKSELPQGGSIPVFHGGLKPIGFTDQANTPAMTVMVINVGASAGNVGWSEKPFWCSDGCFALPHSNLILPKYLYYCASANQRFFVDKVRKAGIPTLAAASVLALGIPVPPLAVQREIVSILDKLDALVNDLTFGLPAEISARRKQYEHYRNKLLTFKELEAA